MTVMAYNNILYEVEDRLATITLNRPERRNALSWALLKKAIREKGLRVALEERDRPFGGIVGRYPPVEE